MIVAKFGGTSMADATQIKKACDIMLADDRRKFMVVSAPGKRFKADIKITDLLISLANAALGGEDIAPIAKAVVDRYKDIIEELNLPANSINVIESDIKDRLSKVSLGKGRFLDLMKAAGEDNCAKVVAMYLSSIGKKAKYISPAKAGMLMTDKAGNAGILPEAYARLSALKDEDGICVFPGFFGVTRGGDIVTFSRGGSDITGSILAVAVGAECYENFTDVDNIFAADPRIIDNPAPIGEITYWQMRELAYGGFSVFHEAAVEPVVRARIPIHIKNTNNPGATGTKIVYARNLTGTGVIAIAGTVGFCNLTISKFFMNSEIGFGRKLFQILEDEGISFDHAPSGIDNISPIIRQDQLTAEILQNIKTRMTNELYVDSIEVSYDIALIVIVSETVYSTKMAAANAVKSLAANGIDISVINVNSNSLSLTIGVFENDLEKSLKTLYKEFFIKEQKQF